MTDVQPWEDVLALHAKLGSIVVHADEMLSSDGHAFDAAALRGLIEDPDVQLFVKQLQAQALVPVKR